MGLVALGFPRNVGEEQQCGGGQRRKFWFTEYFARAQENEDVDAEEQDVFQQRESKNLDTQSREQNTQDPGIKWRLRAVAPLPVLGEQQLFGFVRLKTVRHQRSGENLQPEIDAESYE